MNKNIIILLMAITSLGFSNENDWKQEINTIRGYFIYDDLSMKPTKYGIFNALPFLPIGSYLQGDTKTANYLILAQAIGALMVPSFLMNTYLIPISFVGGLTFVISYIWQLIAPSIYVDWYNKELRKALGMTFKFDIDNKMVVNLKFEKELN